MTIFFFFFFHCSLGAVWQNHIFQLKGDDLSYKMIMIGIVNLIIVTFQALCIPWSFRQVIAVREHIC